MVQEPDALVYMANLAAIVLHVWSSRLATIERPDWCILDLDPKEAPFHDVVTIALALHELCEEIGMPSFVKTSGSSGIHVLLPLGRQVSYEQSQLIGELISRVIVREHPEISTIERVIKKRGKKVYLDYMQNGHGQLLVAPYTVRAAAGSAGLDAARVERGEPRPADRGLDDQDRAGAVGEAEAGSVGGVARARARPAGDPGPAGGARSKVRRPEYSLPGTELARHIVESTSRRTAPSTASRRLARPE